MIRLLLPIFATLTTLTLSAVEPPPAADLFRNGADGYHTFRIPALLTTKGGAVLAFAEARKTGSSDAGDIDLVMKRSTDGGQTWSALSVVWDDAANTCGNPCPVVDEATGRIHLLLTWNSGAEHEKSIRGRAAAQGRRPFYSSSQDEGVTWSRPVDLSSQADREEWGWYATGPGRGIQLTRGAMKGRLVIPANHSRADGTYDAHALYSDDGGQNWKISTALGDGANESTVAELSDGKLVFNTRMQTHGQGQRAVAASDDGGATWSPLRHESALPCPKCEGSLLRYSFADDVVPTSQSVLLFCNPVGPGRSNLTLRASLDEGQTWPHQLLLDAAKGPGYSALTKLPDGRIGILHETTQGLVFRAVPLADLLTTGK